MGNQIIIIGGGFAGLAASACLAKEGYDVTIIEKNESLGGRARKLEVNGFTFDMGPSWYWMPDVFEKYFNRFGKSVEDYYQLKRIDPSYSVFWGKDDQQEIPASLNALRMLFESLEAGSGKKLVHFLEEAAYKYDVGINRLVYKPGRSLREFLDPKLLKGLIKLHVFQSLHTYVRKYFSNQKLIQLLEFPVLFLGAAPKDTPALYSLMNYADMVLGTWYPMGGMHRVIEGMVDLSRSLGVRFELGTSVRSFEIEDKNITRVLTDNGAYKADVVIGSADYQHIDKKILPEVYANYSKKYWDSRKLAPSCLIYYLGINKKLKKLYHHNLFFDTAFSQHAKEIYDKPDWPSDPLFYASCPSKTDPSVAPEGHENLFILIPVAPGLKDTEQIREHYYDYAIRKMEAFTKQDIKKHVVFRKNYAHSNFIHDYNSFKGNAYGLANTLRQTAILKPSIRNKKIKNLYYTGQLTVPGPGVPPSIISGQVVADEVLKMIGKNA